MTRIGFQIIFLMSVSVMCRLTGSSSATNKCQGSNSKLKYLWGDALTDSPDCIGPEHKPYPRQMISRTIKMGAWGGSARTGRNMKTVDPFDMQRGLIDMYKRMKNDVHTTGNRTRRAMDNTCNSGGRLCRTRYNTTAPMYGVSLTSGQPVTIVQKFPDLLQQVVFEVCESRECGVIRGECTQTYVPYLFLVLPLGPVTLTGQDYVLVESGCVCKPTSLTGYTNEANPIAGIP